MAEVVLRGAQAGLLTEAESQDSSEKGCPGLSARRVNLTKRSGLAAG